MDQIKCLTVPELRQLAKGRGLQIHHKSSKKQISARLAIWVRDQVAMAVKSEEGEAESLSMEDSLNELGGFKNDESAGSCSCSNSSSSSNNNNNNDSDEDDDEFSDASSKEELEFFVEMAAKSEDCGDVGDGVSLSNCAEDELMDRGNRASEKTCPLRTTLKALFGHSAFRDGQEWAIRRCLDRKRTLLVAPTGFGKSLCYALTSSLSEGVCIVVSPLISLIEVCTWHSFRNQDRFNMR